jgi:catechol 2,3-dioxygenase-like lactoylglutathione lyase family enzyme
MVPDALSLDLVHIDGRRIRFRREGGSVVVHALGTAASRTLDVAAARQAYERLVAQGFTPADDDHVDPAALFEGGAAPSGGAVTRLVLLVGDLDAQATFYERVLGLPLRERRPDRASFAAGGVAVELVRRPANLAAVDGGRETLPVLVVDDLAAVRRGLEAAGVTVQDAALAGLAEVAALLWRDPEGRPWLAARRPG